MTVCNLCGYDDEKPLGRVAEDSEAGEDVAVALNDNGMAGMFCPNNHLKEKNKNMKIEGK